jgi:hypothetical protein
MRIVALIYFLIALANFWLWLTNGVSQETTLTPHLALTWILYVLCMLSLLAFIAGTRILPRGIWRTVFAVYLSTRVYELLTTGLTITGVDLQTDLNIISSYLWLVVPAGLAMWYLGFSSELDSRVTSQRRQLIAVHERYLP